MNKYYDTIESFGRAEVQWAQGHGFLDTGDLYGLTSQQTQTPHPDNTKGENMQDGSGENEVETRSGKGEDNKGGECL